MLYFNHVVIPEDEPDARHLGFVFMGEIAEPPCGLDFVFGVPHDFVVVEVSAGGWSHAALVHGDWCCPLEVVACGSSDDAGSEDLNLVADDDAECVVVEDDGLSGVWFHVTVSLVERQ